MTPTFEMVRVSDLLLTKEHGVQRAEGISIKRAEQMGAHFDLAKVGTITVSRRKDGTLFVPDGAHRSYAANVAGVKELPAVVHTGLSREDEAALFYGLNDFKAPSPVSRFLARAASGDEVANQIVATLAAHGWRVGRNADDGFVVCVTALDRVYRSGGGILSDGEHGTVLDWTFDIITAAWGHDSEGVSAHIVVGLAQLVSRYGPDIDSKKLVSEMSQTRPKVIVGHAKTLRDAVGGTVPAHVAKVLVGLHNRKRRTNLLPEWVWTR